jgi:hypothetical protein
MGIVELVIVVVVIGGIVIAFFGWDRYRGGRSNPVGGSGVQPTDEVFTDPNTGQLTRVWYDAKTGQREYRPE